MASDENNGRGILPFRVQINPTVFFVSTGLVFLLLLMTGFLPDFTGSLFEGARLWINESVGWFYILSVAIFLIFVIYLAASRFGLVKLGPDDSEPDYRYSSWFAMLFSAGMGIGLMFFGVAEPVMHFVSPPDAEPETIEAARDAMRITFFHWGIHAWAIYAVIALSLAYFSFRHNLPLTIRSSLYPLIGNRIYGPIGHTVDIFAVLGTLFGVATSLGLGVVQVNSGLNYLLGVPNHVIPQMVLIAVITAIATLSVTLGLDRGIRRISELNIILAVGLLLFVLAFGPTIFLLQTLVQNTGNYLSSIMESTFNLYAYEPTDWIGGWTLFYWGWWIAWSPFVGMFIARVSRGRTIREFVCGVLFVPVGFTFMWMTFFGDTALHMILDQGFTELGQLVNEDEASALFEFFNLLPFSIISSFFATLLVITFFVTSSDSGSLVVDMLTSGGKEESPRWQRVFWAVLEGVIAAVLLLVGGLNALQTATIVSALPFTAIMLFVCWGLYRALKLDTTKKTAMQVSRTSPVLHPHQWKKRLHSLLDHASKREVCQYMSKTVEPGLRKVAAELSKRDISTKVVLEEEGKVWIEVYHGEEIDFFYQVRARPYDPPSFALRDTRKKEMEERKYYRAEIYFKEGGQDYDVMNWTEDEIIADVLDQYGKHLDFLATCR